jgi:ATP-dependent DNA helicase PIF1
MAKQKIDLTAKAPEKEFPFELTKNQKQIVNAIEHTNDNIFVTGKPGVGKSVLINWLTSMGIKDYVLTAPTGLAAINIGARTLHSLLALPSSEGIITKDYNSFTTNDDVTNFVRYKVKHLMDRLFRHVKGCDEPFGGIQVIIVGDFYQLPPVVAGDERMQLTNEGYESEFVFSSDVFTEANFKIMPLNEVLRQKGDNTFIDILHAARTGELLPKHVRKLNEQVKAVVDDMRIRLVGTNKLADGVNFDFLSKIKEPVEQFNAIIFGNWPAFPTDKELRLKVGAQVMVKKNGADRPPGLRGKKESRIVNGTIGKVVSIVTQKMVQATEDGPDGKQHPHVVIELEDKTQHKIYIQRWERKKKERGSDGWEEKMLASFEQIPLALAWAVTMHKSQGQSFDKCHIDASKIFADGQFYVALSRCRSLAGCSFQYPVDPAKFRCNPNVRRFYESIE